MKSDIGFHIIDGLKDNQCIILPHFGAFLLKEEPARIHQNTVYPPTKSIGFNQSLKQDDGLLTAIIAKKSQRTFEAAKKEIYSYSASLNYKIRRQESVDIYRVGTFFPDASGNLKFRPHSLEDLDKNTYGFSKITAIPIVREQETSLKSKPFVHKKTKTKQRPATTKTKRNDAISYSIAAVLLLFLLSIGLMVGNVHIDSLSWQNARFFSVGTSSPSTYHSTELSASISPSESASTSYSTTRNVANPVELSVYQTNYEQIPKGFYMIIGSYASEYNAQRLEQKWFDMGYDTYLIPSDNGYTRVGVYTSHHVVEAKDFIDAHKITEPSYWCVQNL